MTDETNAQEKLETIAAQYHYNRQQQQALLEPFRNPILLMRAKYASYDIITEILNQHGVKISVTTVRRFCRMNHAEMMRIRAGLETHKVVTIETPLLNSATNSNSSLETTVETKRQPLTSEPGKRGPRIARDIL